MRARPNPALEAPVEAYLTDGDRLIWILESDDAGALGEDCASFGLVELGPRDFQSEALAHWRRVWPAEDEPAGAKL